MRETLKRYSPKRENVNLGWLNQHLHNPYLWKWNILFISIAFATRLFCSLIPLPPPCQLADVRTGVTFANTAPITFTLYSTHPFGSKPAFTIATSFGTEQA